MDPLDLPPAEPVNVKTSNYFPRMAYLGAWSLLVTGVFALFGSIFTGIFFIVCGLCIITAHYGIKVDFARKTFYDYTSVLWIRSGDRGHFEEIQYVYVNKNKVNKTLRASVASTNFDRYDYNAYLKFSEKQKPHLFSDADKATVIRKAEAIAVRLKCRVVDRTDD